MYVETYYMLLQYWSNWPVTRHQLHTTLAHLAHLPESHFRTQSTPSHPPMQNKTGLDGVSVQLIKIEASSCDTCFLKIRLFCDVLLCCLHAALLANIFGYTSPTPGHGCLAWRGHPGGSSKPLCTWLVQILLVVMCRQIFLWHFLYVPYGGLRGCCCHFAR